MQVEAREEGEEERRVDMGGEGQRESRCRIEERGGGPFGLVPALGALGLASVNNPTLSALGNNTHPLRSNSNMSSLRCNLHSSLPVKGSLPPLSVHCIGVSRPARSP